MWNTLSNWWRIADGVMAIGVGLLNGLALLVRLFGHGDKMYPWYIYWMLATLLVEHGARRLQEKP